MSVIFEDSLAQVRQAVAQLPTSPEARRCLGDMLQIAQQPEEAVLQYEAAIALRPDYAEAHNNLGNVLQTLGRYEQATFEYRLALAVGPDVAEAHANLGNALQALGGYEEAAAEYRAALALKPEYFKGHYNLANALQRLGRHRDAVASYERALAIEPGSADAHINIGNALYVLQRYDESVAHYQQALAIDASSVLAHNNLAIALQELNRFDEAYEHELKVLQLDPDNPEAHQGLALHFSRQGDRAATERHAQLGFGSRLEASPYHGEQPPVRVTVLQSAFGGNVHTRRWLDQAPFQGSVFIVDFCPADYPLPDADVIVNAVGDADRSPAALDSVEALLAEVKLSVINPPSRVRETGRMANAGRLRTIPGVVIPRIGRYPRGLLASDDGPVLLQRDGFSWPLLLRPPGFHTGEHFLKLDDPAELASVAGLPGDELFAIEFVDTRGADGKVRKFRAMAIDGQLYPLHLAISGQWKIHYFSADMVQHPEFRAEEAEFLRDMPTFLGPAAMAALEAVQAALGLDYAGIDFSLDAQGCVVVWEANATMVVAPPPEGERWEYRRPSVEAVDEAVRAMLLARTRQATCSR
ncbi:MAG TPA: tetratricopeptide repeat protein [Chloroflexota bacterium]|nr:tetratricopeptide repeat protein [Chloroflexota bacterium]